MKKLILSLSVLLAVLTLSAQKVYFIYIQTENEQPFYARIQERVLHSSASGYLILSKLVDSTYTFTIGFPDSRWTEQAFTVSMNRQDHGYLLKNFEEKGWGLFDLQTMGVQMSMTGAAEKTKPENKEVSAFTDILSKAADDPTLKENTVQPKVEEKKPQPEIKEVVKTEEPKPVVPEKTKAVTAEEKPAEKPVVKTEEKPVEKPVEKPAEKPAEKITEPAPVTKQEVVTKPVQTEPETAKKEEPKPELKEKSADPVPEKSTGEDETYKPTSIKKWSESSTTEGFGLVFIDIYEDGTKDTIRLLIPNQAPVVSKMKEEPKKEEEKKFLDIVTGEKEKTEEAKPVLVTGDTEPVAEKAVIKNNCPGQATESDFFKLRKKMAGEIKEDNMIAEARKVYKLKCFSTAQVRNLGTLFLTDEGKYNFFDASYKYVEDPAAFASLQSELKDTYFINRFKAMLRN